MNKCKVLVVDDDPELSRLMAVILDRMGGYEVKEENESISALWTARKFRPNLILMDINMPDKNGRVLCAEIGNDAELGSTPVVFVSGCLQAGEVGLRNGHRYLQKPIDPYTLLETVAMICGKGPMEPSRS